MLKPWPRDPRYKISDTGEVIGLRGRPLRGYAEQYLRVNTRSHGNVQVHTMVLETFVSERPEGMECRHLDGDRLNNRLKNLRWGTAAENSQDRIQHGTQACGTQQHLAKLDDEKVREARVRHAAGEPSRKLARDYGVTNQAMWAAINKLTWKHVH